MSIHMSGITTERAIELLNPRLAKMRRIKEGEAEQAYKKAADALKKQQPKPVVNDGAFGKCPACGYVFNSELADEYEMDFCLCCGQALDWRAEK